MSIYDVNFNITTVELLPTHKRLDRIEDVLFSLQKPLNDDATLFRYIREGTEAAAFNPVTVYTFGQYTAYQRRTYQRNEITEGYVAGIIPTNTTYWTKVLDNNIGLSTRIRFSPQKILLEYALNIIFETQFNQPPVLSDIYITNENNDDDAFFVGELDDDTSTVSQTDQEADWFVTELDADTGQPDFIVHVPVAVWTALAGTSQERDNIILSVVNKLKLFGYAADIETY